MAQQHKADPGTVGWVDLQTPDLDAARRFYGELLGWSFVGGEDASMGFYTTARLGERSVAGMAKLGPSSPFPPAWSVYIATDDVDELASKVGAAGGKVIVPPMDVADQGRMAYFADPTGAVFGAWQGKKHLGAEVVNETGAMAWHEVYTRDATKAREFYARVLALEPKRLDAPDVEYWTLHKGPKTAFGLMQMSEKQFPKQVPSHWNTYFAVRDADAAVKKVESLGGKIISPAFDTPYGRMAVVTDPFGAAFCVIVPSPAMSAA